MEQQMEVFLSEKVAPFDLVISLPLSPGESMVMIEDLPSLPMIEAPPPPPPPMPRAALRPPSPVARATMPLPPPALRKRRKKSVEADFGANEDRKPNSDDSLEARLNASMHSMCLTVTTKLKNMITSCIKIFEEQQMQGLEKIIDQKMEIHVRNMAEQQVFFQKEMQEQAEFFDKKLEEQQDMFEEKTVNLEKMVDQQQQEMLQALGKIVDQKMESHVENMEEQQEVLEKRMYEQEEFFQKKLEEQDEFFKKKFGKQQEIFQKKMHELEEKFGKRFKEMELKHSAKVDEQQVSNKVDEFKANLVEEKPEGRINEFEAKMTFLIEEKLEKGIKEFEEKMGASLADGTVQDQVDARLAEMIVGLDAEVNAKFETMKFQAEELIDKFKAEIKTRLSELGDKYESLKGNLHMEKVRMTMEFEGFREIQFKMLKMFEIKAGL